MPTITIYGTSYELPPIPPNSGKGGGFAFAVARGGSSMMNSALRMVTNQKSPVSYMSLPGYFHERAVAIEPSDTESLETLRSYLSAPGTIFGGWRGRPHFPLPLFENTRTFLLVRDPRDVLTSLYFYQINVSKRADPETSIDEFVLRMAKQYSAIFRAYDDLATMSDLKVLRYEDIIFDKPYLLTTMSEHFGVGARKEKIERIARQVDKHVSEDAPTEHVRQVRPGDHARKLRPRTISELTDVFSDVLNRYGYSDARVGDPVNAQQVACCGAGVASASDIEAVVADVCSRA
jgi:sulfotransferase family protein